MKINPMCDLLVGNRPENDSDTQYYECEDCYRYEICKNYGCVEMFSLKEIKEATPNILEPSYDLLKQEGDFEMSMISELIKNLRWYGSYADSAEKDLMYEAADAIQTLSAKLAAANMERSDRHYVGGWQPISEYSRDKYDWVLIKYFDGEEECVPQVAELRSDGKWHVSTDFDGDFIIPSHFDVRYFFDMQQLDRS